MQVQVRYGAFNTGGQGLCRDRDGRYGGAYVTFLAAPGTSYVAALSPIDDQVSEQVFLYDRSQYVQPSGTVHHAFTIHALGRMIIILGILLTEYKVKAPCDNTIVVPGYMCPGAVHQDGGVVSMLLRQLNMSHAG